MTAASDATLVRAARSNAAPPPSAGGLRGLRGLLPFLRPYRGRIALAGVFLLAAAGCVLALPGVLKALIDRGLIASDPAVRIMALREHFFALFAVGVALALFSAARLYMVNLLLRWYDVSEGSIAIDGVPVERCALAALRARIGIVPQDPVIFSASVGDNIRYGRPEASDTELIAAARAAHADEFIRGLPDGYAAHLGERGVRLSGGQRQRISIARALLKQPTLLLLDEATSALDAESERAVQAALSNAMQGRTTLVIAHRLATVQRADRIVVMEAGQIVDIGTHAELIARAGLYARLAALQFEV